MKRFFERIQQKALEPAEPPVVIVAFGDSVTQGATENGRYDPENVYHRLLQQKLEARYPLTTFSTINAGVCGNTTRSGLKRMHRDVIRYQPDLVLVAFGLNDCFGGDAALPDFERALRTVVAEVRRGCPADIVLLTPPFMADTFSDRIHSEHLPLADGIMKVQKEGTLSRYAEAVRNVAKSEETLLADVHAEWTRLAESGAPVNDWLINGLNHPGPKGHHLAAETVFSSLTAQSTVLVGCETK